MLSETKLDNISNKCFESHDFYINEDGRVNKVLVTIFTDCLSISDDNTLVRFYLDDIIGARFKTANLDPKNLKVENDQKEWIENLYSLKLYLLINCEREVADSDKDPQKEPKPRKYQVC